MGRPPLSGDFTIALRLLSLYELPHAEAWRHLVPVAVRLGVPRPSYTTVRRILVTERRRRSHAEALARVIAVAVGGVFVAEAARVLKHKAFRRHRLLRLRE